jgi:hypothetical protein
VLGWVNPSLLRGLAFGTLGASLGIIERRYL